MSQYNEAFILNILLFHFSYIYIYIPNAVKLPILLGNSPLNILSPIHNSFNWFNWPIYVDNLPSNVLLDKRNLCKFFNLIIILSFNGLPDNSLSSTSNVINLSNFDNDIGIVPINLLLNKSNISNWLNDIISFGNSPIKLFSAKRNTLILPLRSSSSWHVINDHSHSGIPDNQLSFFFHESPDVASNFII